MAVVEKLFSTLVSVFVSSPLLCTAVALLSVLVVLYGWLRSSPGPNPFTRDSRRTAEPLLRDQTARDRIIKQGFSRDKVPQELDAVVIGSGIGGLSCAALLSKAGKKVLVLEQHDQAGGCCHTFHDKGFEFDTGIHYIGEMQSNGVLKFYLDQITEGQLLWSPLEDEYDHVAIGDLSDPKIFPIRSGKNDFVQGLLEKFPDEEKAVGKYMELLRDVRRSVGGYLMLKFLPLWISRFLLSSGLLKFVTPFFSYSQRSLKEVLEEITDNQDLRAVLAYSFGDYGTLPQDASFAMHAILVNHFLYGCSYPVGGASEIARHIIPVIEKAGGKVLVRAPVAQILVDENKIVKGVRVKKSSGNVDIAAPLVISNAGLFNTYERLLPPAISTKTFNPLKLDGVQHGIGGMSVYIGLRGSNKDLGLTARNVWAFTGNDLDQISNDYLNLDVEEVGKSDVPLLFISFPSTKDPTWEERFPGKSTCTIVSLAKYEWFEPWENERVMKRGAEYAELKDRLGRRMWEQVCRKFPHLEDKVEFFDVGSPVTNRYYIEAPRGEMYGIDHHVQRFSPESVIHLRPQTSLQGLFLTGQDVFSCGFAGALFGGLFCASAVLNRNLYQDLTQLKKTSKKMK